jgi:hypothetical protein
MANYGKSLAMDKEVQSRKNNTTSDLWYRHRGAGIGGDGTMSACIVHIGAIAMGTALVAGPGRSLHRGCVVGGGGEDGRDGGSSFHR